MTDKNNPSLKDAHKDTRVQKPIDHQTNTTIKDDSIDHSQDDAHLQDKTPSLIKESDNEKPSQDTKNEQNIQIHNSTDTHNNEEKEVNHHSNVTNDESSQAEKKVASTLKNHHDVNRQRYAGRYKVNDDKQVYIKETDQDLPNAFYAGFWIRTIAYLFDLLMIFLISQILTNVFWVRIFGAGFEETWIGDTTQIATYVLYFLLINIILNGQTLGKVLFGLKVVSIKQDQLDLTTIIIREGFGRIVFYFLYIIMVTLVFTEKKQHVIDILSDTSVVRLKYIDAMNDFIQYNHRTIPA